MKVILKEDVRNVGKKDQIINASDGYAKNYLIPRGLAVLADTHNINNLEAKQKANIAQKARNLEESKKMAEELKNKMITLKVKAGNNGRLFGGVTSKEISDGLKDQLNVDIDKKKVLLNEVIKQEGVFNVDLKLQEGVIACVKVKVTGEK